MNAMERGKLNIIIDGGWGSSGKGKLAAWLAKKNNVFVSVSGFGPNAGHTYIEEDGTQVVLKFLPSAAANPITHLCIGPDSVIKVQELLEEIKVTKSEHRLTIHPHAAVLEQRHVEGAQKTGRRLAGTMKGTGWAIAEKLLRKEEMKLAKHIPELKRWIGDTQNLINSSMKDGGICMAETAQGYDLSLNWGHEWPYVSSRDITVGTAMNNAGVSHRRVGKVWGCIRTFPIRVGNLHVNGEQVGWSGPWYDDQKELTWEDVTKSSGSPTALSERTTVTKKIRRVFNFSMIQLEKFLRATEPEYLFINFLQYLDWKVAGITRPEEISDEVQSWLANVRQVCNRFGTNIAALGTGPKHSEVVNLL